ncbi:MAG TPA: polysaccharide biosynthesis protein, partial [Bacillota bacterium]
MSQGPSAARPSFLRSTFVLASANFATKVIGGLIVIPLYYLLGSEGMGLYNSAYRIYTILLIISTQGVNIVIARLVAERMAVDDRQGAERVFAVSFWLLSSLGLVFALLFWWGAPFLVRLFSIDERSYLSMVSLAPAIFLVAVMSVYRGFLQGLQRMTPFAMSQFIEQVARVIGLFIILPFVFRLGVQYGAAAATFGAVIGATVSLAYLVWKNRSIRAQFGITPGGDLGSDDLSQSPLGQANLGGLPGEAGLPADTTPPTGVWVRLGGPFDRGDRAASWRILKNIIYLAIPITFAGVAAQLIQFLDVALVQARLKAGGIEQVLATQMFGQLSGAAMLLVNLPTMFAGAFFLALIPAISEARQLKRPDIIRHRTVQSLQLTLALTIPAAVGLLVLPSQIGDTLFGDAGAGVTISAAAVATIFLSLQQTTSGILYGLGRSAIPIYNLIAGGAVKAGLTWWLTAIPALNVRGAAYATVIGFLVAGGLNWLAVERLVRGSLDWVKSVVKPLVASAFMAAAAFFGYRLLLAVVHHAKIATLLAVGLAAAVYFIVLIAVGGLDDEEFGRIPIVGRYVVAVLRPLHIGRGR